MKLKTVSAVILGMDVPFRDIELFRESSSIVKTHLVSSTSGRRDRLRVNGMKREPGGGQINLGTRGLR